MGVCEEVLNQIGPLNITFGNLMGINNGLRGGLGKVQGGKVKSR